MAERKVVRPYWQMLAAQVRSQAQYRTSFIADLVTQTAFTAADFIGILVMFSVGTELGGFGLVELMVVTGLAATGFAIADLAVGNVERLKSYVRTGLLDAMLIRPRRVLPQLLVIDFQLRRVGRVAFAATVLAIATGAADIDWTWWRVVLVVTIPLAGAAYFSSMFVMTASVAFWWIESGEFANAVTYGGKEFSTYPVNIYEGIFRRFFAYGLGFSFIAYYPALLILGEVDPLGLPPWFGWGAYPVAVVIAVVAGLVWRTGIRHYKGTGS
ncbi:MAG: ABC transporter permease [Stackebrandtia sp.]